MRPDTAISDGYGTALFAPVAVTVIGAVLLKLTGKQFEGDGDGVGVGTTHDPEAVVSRVISSTRKLELPLPVGLMYSKLMT